MSKIHSAQEKYITLSNGTKMPRAGYGTWDNNDDTVEVIKKVIKAGYRHIDTAKVYGNEAKIGQAIKESIAEGVVKREDLYIVTKIWNSDKHDVEGALKGSLERLQLDYVDQYLIHWPAPEMDKATGNLGKHVPLHITWKALEDQVKAGRTKSIGVSNFNVQLLIDLLSYAEIKPVTNQIELHPYLVQEDLVNFCKKNDIEIVAFSPLGGNFNWNKEVSGKTLMEEPILKEIAAKHGKTVGQVILNWHLSRGYTVIPKTTTESRIKENLTADSFQLTEEEVKKISSLDRNARVCDAKDQFKVPIFALKFYTYLVINNAVVYKY